MKRYKNTYEKIISRKRYNISLRTIKRGIYQVLFSVDVQTFYLNYASGRESCLWYIKQLDHALKKLTSPE